MGYSWIWRSELGINDLSLLTECGFGEGGAGRDPGFVRDLLAGTTAIYSEIKYEEIHCFPLRC